MLSIFRSGPVLAGLLIIFPVACGAADGSVEGQDGSEAAVSAADLSRRPDDRRPDDQFQIQLWGRPLTIGGEYEFEPTWRKDFDFDNSGDDLLRLDQQIELELLYGFSPDLALFLEGKAFYRKDLHEENGPEKDEDSFERGEMWLYARQLYGSNWGVQAGRQNFIDGREWWWDEDLDAVRLHYDRKRLHAEIAIAEELARVSTLEDDLDPEKEDVFRILGSASWRWAKRHSVEFFFLDQDDSSGTPALGAVVSDTSEDEVDSDLTWYGLRAQGRIKAKKPLAGRFHYWVDYGYVRGRETLIDFDPFGPGQIFVDDIDRRDVRGWATDLGVTWETKWALRPRITLGYAYGSGDDNPADGTDRAYHQTGMHDNNDKFRGVDSFRYYGELLRPELSNLHIVTLAIGFPLLENSSVELVFHNYRQVHASDSLRNARLDADPDGISRSIGTEYDIVLGIEEWKHLELELVLGVFRAGSAFGADDGEYASTAIFKLNYNF